MLERGKRVNGAQSECALRVVVRRATLQWRRLAAAAYWRWDVLSGADGFGTLCAGLLGTWTEFQYRKQYQIVCYRVQQ